jgi:glycosyltransferase involved in cell wall biosynthesis
MQKRLRVMFLADTPHRQAGAQRSLMLVLRELPRLGIDPVVVAVADGVVADAYRRAGIDVRILQAPPGLLRFAKAIVRLTPPAKLRLMATELAPYNLKLASYIRRERFDVCHFNSPRGMLVGGVAAKLAGRKTVMHVCGTPTVLPRSMWLASQALADRIVFVARVLVRFADGPFQARATAVHDGFDLGYRPTKADGRVVVAEALGITVPELASKPLFVFASTLTPWKGAHHLLDAMARLESARGRDARLVVMGIEDESTYPAWIRERVRTLGLGDRVFFVGHRPEPLPFLAAADALVLPTIEDETLDYGEGPQRALCGEGFPRVVIESLALGTIPVASRVAGVHEQVEDGVHGLLVPPSDPGALARALERVLSDESFARTARSLGPPRVEELFSVDRAARGLAAVLRDAIADSPTPQ